MSRKSTRTIRRLFALPLFIALLVCLSVPVGWAAPPLQQVSQNVLPAGAVVALTGTPHLWIADEFGILHWGGDTRALAGKSINWSDQRNLTLDQLRSMQIGDPWLSTSLLKDGDPIYLVKWETDSAAPTLAHIQSIGDVELFGINGTNYGKFTLEKAVWQERFGNEFGIDAGTLPKAELSGAVATPASTPVPAATSVPPPAPPRPSGGSSGGGSSGGSGGGGGGDPAPVPPAPTEVPLPTATLVPSSTATLVPTAVATATLTATATRTATATPTATRTPASTPTDSQVHFDFDTGVNANDRSDIVRGVSEARSSAVGNPITNGVTVTVTLGAAGNVSCCGADAPSKSITVNVNSDIWTRASQGQYSDQRFYTVRDEHIKHVAHEYAHLWQGTLGCNQPGIPAAYRPAWFIEGGAEYFGHAVVGTVGGLKPGGVAAFLRSALQQDSTHLSQYEASVNTGPNPYGVSYAAIQRLVDLSGENSLRAVCTAVGSGSTWQTAFQQTFGMTVSAFYDNFEQYRQTVTSQTVQSQNHPVTASATATPTRTATATRTATRTSTVTPSSTPTQTATATRTVTPTVTRTPTSTVTATP